MRTLVAKTTLFRWRNATSNGGKRLKNVLIGVRDDRMLEISYKLTINVHVRVATTAKSQNWIPGKVGYLLIFLWFMHFAWPRHVNLSLMKTLSCLKLGAKDAEIAFTKMHIWTKTNSDRVSSREYRLCIHIPVRTIDSNVDYVGLQLVST